MHDERMTSELGSIAITNTDGVSLERTDPPKSPLCRNKVSVGGIGLTVGSRDYRGSIRLAGLPPDRFVGSLCLVQLSLCTAIH